MTDTDLIERLEKATEGSRELDVRIHVIQLPAGQIMFNGLTAPIVLGRAESVGDWHGAARHMETPHYTTSIDAALTLVPERFHLDCLTTGDPDTMPSNPRHYSGCILRPDLNNDEGWANSGASCDKAATPALALCIAALRARQSETPHD